MYQQVGYAGLPVAWVLSQLIQIIEMWSLPTTHQPALGPMKRGGSQEVVQFASSVNFFFILSDQIHEVTAECYLNWKEKKWKGAVGTRETRGRFCWNKNVFQVLSELMIMEINESNAERQQSHSSVDKADYSPSSVHLNNNRGSMTWTLMWCQYLANVCMLWMCNRRSKLFLGD